MKKIAELPFDLFSRHYIVKNLVNKSFRHKKETLTILDLGGYAGKTEDFFVDDKVTVLDIYDIKDKKNYIKGDATKLSFMENSYDIVTSFDVFEHIPRESRKKFITEALRVSTRAVILTFPTDHNSKRITSEAESTLDSFFKSFAGSRHPWLREHIDYGIPETSEFEKLLNSIGVIFAKISSNSIDSWKMMQTVNFLSTVDELALQQAELLNEQYNTHIESIENNIKEGYRSIYILFKDKKYQQAIERSIKNLHESPVGAESISDKEFQKQAFDVIIKLFANTMKRYKKSVNDYAQLLRQNKHQEASIQRLQKEIIELKQSPSWRITAPFRKIKKLIRK